MPKQTTFTICDALVDGPYMLSHETVRGECGAAYDAWMSRLEKMQSQRKDFCALDRKGRAFDTYVDIKFFRTHPTKDMTIVNMGTLYHSMCPSTVEYNSNAIAWTPAMAYATGGSKYFHFLAWAGVVEATAVVSTGYPEFSEDSVFPVAMVTNRMKKLGDLVELGTLPVIYNSPCGDAAVSFRREGGGSRIIGVAMSVAKKCVNCELVATAENASLFKMCGRCKTVTGIPVWYCSKGCQDEDYHGRHRKICKHTADLTLQKNRYIEAAEQGETWAVCQLCGIKPTWATVHMFHRCARCMKNGGHTVLYCGNKCQRVDYPKHRPLCQSRMLAVDTEDFLTEFVGQLDEVKQTYPDVYDRLHCDDLRDELARAMDDAGLPPA